jgi:hypothetical protein
VALGCVAVVGVVADADGLAFVESLADVAAGAVAVAGGAVRVAVLLLEPPPQAERPIASASEAAMLTG